jgi:hypothetical protein
LNVIFSERVNELVIDNLRRLRVTGQGDEIDIGSGFEITGQVCGFALVERFERTERGIVFETITVIRGGAF